MATFKSSKPVSALSDTLQQAIAAQESSLLHTDVVPELLCLGWGLVQRVYFFEQDSARKWKRSRVTVLPRPLSLAFARQDLDAVRDALGAKHRSVACLVYSMELGPVAEAPNAWQVLTVWADAHNVVRRAHRIDRKGRTRSCPIQGDFLDTLPEPLRQRPDLVASMEREYRLVVHGLSRRIGELLDAFGVRVEAQPECVLALEALALELSARRADDVLASYLGVCQSVQSEANLRLNALRDDTAKQLKRQMRQTEERVRRMQHQLDVANKRADALVAQLTEARAALACRNTDAAAPRAEASPETGDVEGFEAVCAARLSTSRVWSTVFELSEA